MTMGITIFMDLRSYSAESAAHRHDHYQWVLPIQGELELEIGQHANQVSIHRGAFIQLGEKHCFASRSTNQFLVLDVDPGNGWMKQMEIPAFWELSPALRQYLQFAKLYLEQQNNAAGANALIKDMLLKLLSQNFLSQFDKRILAAKTWIDVHFALPIDVKRLAQNCHLSTSQLQRRFQLALGLSVAEYWRSRRLQQAQYLLQNRAQSIETIAHQVGFESLAAFSRRFSHAFGLPPSQWRNDAAGKKKASRG